MKKTNNNGSLGKALLMGTALVSLSAVDAMAVTGTGTMDAVVLTPIVIANQQNLHFGSVTVAAATAGTVAIPAAGGGAARAAGGAGGVTLIAGAANEANGILRVTGGVNVAMDLTFTPGPNAGAYPVTSGGDTMDVDSFNFVTDAGGTTATITIPTTATFIDVPVGATLNVAAGQAAGTYTGTYNVDVAYQ